MDEAQRPATEEELAECSRHLDKFKEGLRDVSLESEAVHYVGIFQLRGDMSLQQATRSGFKFPFWPGLGMPAHIKRGKDGKAT